MIHIIQLGICFGIAQDSYALAHTLPDINIINTWVEKDSHNSECTYYEIMNRIRWCVVKCMYA